MKSIYPAGKLCGYISISFGNSRPSPFLFEKVTACFLYIKIDKKRERSKKIMQSEKNSKYSVLQQQLRNEVGAIFHTDLNVSQLFEFYYVNLPT